MSDRFTRINENFIKNLMTPEEHGRRILILEVDLRIAVANALCCLASQMPYASEESAARAHCGLTDEFGWAFVENKTGIVGASCMIDRAIDVRAKSEEIARRVR